MCKVGIRSQQEKKQEKEQKKLFFIESLQFPCLTRIGTWQKPGQSEALPSIILAEAGREAFFFVVPGLEEYGLRVDSQIPTVGQCLRKWTPHQRGQKWKVT